MKRWVLSFVVFISGCGSMAGVPYLSRKDLCTAILDHWAARTLACHHTVVSVSDAKCESGLWVPPSDAAKADCLDDVDARSCDAIDSLPASCVRLFPSW